MLIIGHRGAIGLAPEETLAAFREGNAAADILGFDILLTRNNLPVVVHDSPLLKAHKKSTTMRLSSHTSIKEAIAKGHKVAALEEVLDMFFGKILLNLEIKSRGAGKVIAQLIKDKYIKEPGDWQNILFSSSKARELASIRKLSPQAELALYHGRNSLAFIAYYRRLNLTAVGFHRLHINPLALEVAKQLKIFTYVYTVNRPDAAKRLADEGIDGIVTDNPALIKTAIDDIL